MQIIGICGRAHSGKTTLGKQIGGTYLPFAKFLKEGLIGMGLPSEWIYDPELKFTPQPMLGGKTPRWAMQSLGTEWGRELIHPDIWVLFWIEAVKKVPLGTTVVVDDVRFPNEIAALKHLGALIVAVTRPAPQRRFHEIMMHKILGDRLAHHILTYRKHESERLRFEDHGIPLLMNDGTPEELYQKFLSEYTHHKFQRTVADMMKGVNDTASRT